MVRLSIYYFPKEVKGLFRMNTRTKKIVMAALLAALACIATMVIKVPSPLGGYLNLGDCIVLMAGWMLPPAYGFVAAGLGSALADVFSGYVAYAPATFIIKGLMALIVCFGFKLLRKKLGTVATGIISGLVAEIVMVAGYLVFEGAFLYGFGPSLANVLPNGIQGAAGLVIGVILIKLFEKSKIA